VRSCLYPPRIFSRLYPIAILSRRSLRVSQLFFFFLRPSYGVPFPLIYPEMGPLFPSTPAPVMLFSLDHCSEDVFLVKIRPCLRFPLVFGRPESSAAFFCLPYLFSHRRWVMNFFGVPHLLLFWRLRIYGPTRPSLWFLRSVTNYRLLLESTSASILFPRPPRPVSPPFLDEKSKCVSLFVFQFLPRQSVFTFESSAVHHLPLRPRA